MPRVTVVIPTWNGLEHLPECMAALGRQTFADFDVVVVDNASEDESVAWLRENSPEARVIERADNGGFSVAVNEGIRAATGEYVALLNNDTAADERWLAELVRTLDETGYDFAASLMVFYDRPDEVNAAGDYYDVSVMSARNRGIHGAVSDYLVPMRVWGACAGAALYRRRLFDEIGFFDEDYFLNHEDSDLNLRALIAGKKCAYVPTAVIRHKHNVTIRTQPKWRIKRLVIRNRAATFIKSAPWPLLPLVLVTRPWVWFWDTFPPQPRKWRQIPGRMRTLRRRVRAELGGFRMGWPKRREVLRLQAVPTTEVLRWLFRGTGPLE